MPASEACRAWYTPAMLLVLACAAAALAGFIDAIAGGGGLIQVPALLLLYPEVPVPLLLGTNKVASIAGTLNALRRYARNVQLPWSAVAPAAFTAFVGAFGGARLALVLPTTWMRPIVVGLLAGVALFTFARKDFGAVRGAVRAPILAAAALGGGLGLYDGFFGPGTGSFLLFGLVALLGLDFLGASAAAKLINVSTNFAAILAFAWAGAIRWELALPMAACNVAGSEFGSRLAIAKGAPFVRRLFLGVVVVLLARMVWDLVRIPAA